MAKETYEIVGYVDDTPEEYQVVGVDPGAQFQFAPSGLGAAGTAFLEAANAMPGMKEGASGVNAAIDALLGRDTFGESYNKYRDKWNQAVASSAAAGEAGPSLPFHVGRFEFNPNTSDVLNLAGGIGSMAEFGPLSKLPYIGPAIGKVFGMSEAALPGTVGKQLATNAAKAGIKSFAKNVGASTLQNALAGSAFGFAGGQGGVEERLAAALDAAKLGGTMGAGMAGGLGLTGLIGKGLLPVGEDLFSAIRSGVSKEPPAIPAGIGSDVPTNLLTASLARDLVRGGVMPAQLPQIEKYMASEVIGGHPTYLPEAVLEVTGNPGLINRANALAQTPDAFDVFSNALAQRQLGTMERTQKILNVAGEEASPWTTGKELQQGAGNMLKIVEDKTGKAAKQAYKDLEKRVGIVEDPIIPTLLEESPVKKAIKLAKESNREIRDLPDNHFRVLHETYKIVRDEARDLQKPNSKNYKPTIGKLRDDQIVKPLRDALDAHNTDFPEIRAKYGEYKLKLQDINESGIEVLQKLKANQVDDAAKVIFNQSPEQIGKLMESIRTYSPALEKQMKNLVRQYVSKNAHNAETMAAAFKKWQGDNPRIQEVIKKILGPEETAKLNELAHREQRIQTVSGKYTAGSPTSRLIADKEAQAEFRNAIVKAIMSPAKAAKKWTTKAFEDPTDLLDTALARAYTDPNAGLTLFRQAMPLAMKQGARRETILTNPNLAMALAKALAGQPGAIGGIYSNLDRGE